MGVPSFFAWLLRNFKKKILLKKLDMECDYFFVDANCLFHPECNKIKDEFPNIDIMLLEKKMNLRIKDYLTYLFNYVDAKQINGTFVDGPAPLTKMAQQRKRRYKSIEDSIIRNKIKNKYKKNINNNWNNTVITPGTTFMENLHQELLIYFKNIKTKGKHIYSSYHSCGEGEHKLLQELRKMTKLL
jgi:5'-3' exonuclease